MIWVGAYETGRCETVTLDAGESAESRDREMNGSVLPNRSGSRPKTTPTNPHMQLEQNPQREVVEELARRVFALPGVEERPSAISVPGARALWLREDVPAGSREAFMIGREFAHIHPMPKCGLPTPHPRSRNFMQRSYIVWSRDLISCLPYSLEGRLHLGPIHHVGYVFLRMHLPGSA